MEKIILTEKNDNHINMCKYYKMIQINHKSNKLNLIKPFIIIIL
jgi:hypothetical protein